MRRPSIPFEAIGLGARRRQMARDAGTLLHRALMETTTMIDPNDPKHPPTNIPPGDLSDGVGQVPADFVEDDAEEVGLEDDDEDEDEDEE